MADTVPGSPFCPETKGTLRCVLNVNHDGICQFQSSSSLTVRMIDKREADLKKMAD